jgi:hypothetical protein
MAAICAAGIEKDANGASLLISDFIAKDLPE